MFREIYTIKLSLLEELDLLRYPLRVNSTRMRRSTWKSKNLPRYEDNPWTFVSPLFSISNDGVCQHLNYQLRCAMWSIPLPVGSGGQVNYHYASQVICAACYVKSYVKVELKKCSRCKKISYCSSICQKNHWLALKHVFVVSM